MLFTGNDVVQYAYDRVPAKRRPDLDPHLIARQLNDITRLLVRKVVAEDPERLAGEVVVSNVDVAASPDHVDLTSSSTREWMDIAYMDFRTDAAGSYDGNEVVVGTIEARHRLVNEFAHLDSPIGYLYDSLGKLKKVSGWDNVWDLRVYGVLLPTPWDPQDSVGFTRVADYPEPLFRSLQALFLLRVSGRMNATEADLAMWVQEAGDALADLLDDAEAFLSGGIRIEDVPHVPFGG